MNESNESNKKEAKYGSPFCLLDLLDYIHSRQNGGMRDIHFFFFFFRNIFVGINLDNCRD